MARNLLGHIAFLAVAALPLFVSAQFDAYGEWVHYMNLGTWGSPDRKCHLRFIEERRYQLNRNVIDGEPPNGVYASILHGRWINGEPGECQHPELGVQRLFVRARTWFIDLVPTGTSSFAVQAKWSDCVGDGCDAPELFKGEFSTNLVQSDNELHDQGDPTRDEGVLVFKPIVDAQRQSYMLANQFLERWTAIRTTQSLSEFAKRNFDPRFGVPPDELSKILERYRASALGEGHAGFHIVEAYLLAADPNAMPPEPLLFLVVANRRVDGRLSQEIFELTQSESIWRVSYMK